MENNPLVTVICLCFNHKDFVGDAIQSVLEQSYEQIQIIAVDDGSTDGSQSILKSICHQSGIELMLLPQNTGNCKAFNKAFAKARGKYVIDFATDDLMSPNRIALQVAFFEKQSDQVGVIFSNGEIIDKKGDHLGYHYPVDINQKSKKEIPQGEVFASLLSSYFIAAPTMMMKKQVLNALEGYDENLAYEDFDFWVRSSRNYHYAYQDMVLTKVRKLSSSLGHQTYKPGDPQLYSTYLVCKKAMKLLNGQKEQKALSIRLKYEARQAVFSKNFNEAGLLINLLERIAPLTFTYKFLKLINDRKINLSLIARLYHFVKP